MAEELPKFDTKLGWQIDRRARIQALLFEIHKFLERYSEFPHEPPEERHWMQMCWMVDASFSLWRSAFLTDTPRDRATIYEHMKEFIKKVLEHNAITFADDHRMRSLAVGYYNANAKYRIQKLYSSNPPLLEYETIQAVDQLHLRGDLAKEDQAALWDIYYQALVDAFAWFQANWSQTARPATMIKKKQPPASGQATTTAAGGSTP